MTLARDTSTRSALVTGGSRGIGLGVAQALATRGYDLTLGARDEARLEEVGRPLRDLGITVVTVPTDVAQPDELNRLIAAHRETHKRLDALILAAGVGTAGPIEDYPARRFRRQLDVNLCSAFHLIQGCLPMLREAAAHDPDRGAKVVALASITGAYAEPSLAAYGASKAALISLCQSLNVEEAANGVTGCAISPAYVDTDMTEWIRSEVRPDDMITVRDVVEVVLAALGLSSRSTLPHVIIGRARTTPYHA